MNTYSQRLSQVRSLFDEWEADALLLKGEANRRWLSNFTGSNAWLLITAEDACLATDFRYWEQAQSQSPHFQLFKMERLHSIKTLLQSVAGCRVALERQHITLGDFALLKEVEEIDWLPRERTVEPLRAVKTADEVDMIRRSAAITDQVMEMVPELARPGLSERELAWQLEREMRESGADSLAFSVVVASGPNAALPHHRPGARTLQAGEALLIDMGAVVDGYRSDMTRTFFLGDTPDDTFWEIYNLVLDAQVAALEALKPGLSGPEVDKVARDIIGAQERADQFGHGLGHGVGLEIHEDPRLSPTGTDEPLQERMVTSVEPGVYVPGWGGVRIEDLVALTADGVEILSQCSKEPIIPLE
ncbi:MAG TPA: aminopeptidase P family protein [Candidatus Sulfomarinibacteraceae bacterium]|nr:aminopeptidase P family protein [Candidatus Sulfomarinibacteraceae bacterium]